jgi:hypothetical protein
MGHGQMLTGKLLTGQMLASKVRDWTNARQEKN